MSAGGERYLTYEEYQRMGGTADPATFDRLLPPALGRLMLLTHWRVEKLDPVPEGVKRALVEGLEVLAAQRAMDADGPMRHFENDGMSITLERGTAQEREAAVTQAMLDCLWGVKAADGKTPVLYAGVGDER